MIEKTNRQDETHMTVKYVLINLCRVSRRKLGSLLYIVRL